VTHSPELTVPDRLKRAANWLNGSTALGFVIVRVGRARVSSGPCGLYLAGDYRFGFPVAGAFTVGNVVVSQRDWAELQVDQPKLIEHEDRHSWPYVVCCGLPFLPLYAAALAWSWLRTGDFSSRNVFERHAGLATGGYGERPTRPLRMALGLRPKPSA
jgi:hypothetical protein